MMISRDKDRESVLSHGYVKDCYRVDGFENILTMPYYLCELTSRCVLFEILHNLLNRDSCDYPHLTTDVDKILSSVVTENVRIQ